MMFPRLPIGAKIAAACAALIGVAIVVFACGTLLNIYSEQIEAADVALDTGAKLVAERLSHGGLARDGVAGGEFAAMEPLLAFAVFDASGRIVRTSDNMPEPVAHAGLASPRPTTVQTANGSWRVKSVGAHANAAVVAYDLAETNEIVRDLVVAYLVSLPFACLVAGLGGWWVATWALRPVRALTRAAEHIRAQNLTARVPAPAARDEIAHLAQVLNAMLARLETSFQQAERFAADASHELRTPLTIFRGEIEALLRDEQLSPTAEQRLASLQEEINRMEQITSTLLLLARLDAGAAHAERRPVDLGAVVTEACQDIEPLATSAGVSLETAIDPRIWIDGDRLLLRRFILNLLDNAAKFNVGGGQVRCVVARHADRAQVRVSNTGPSIPAEMRPRVFERFFRADVARTKAGHGLGLALSREIVRAHGGELSLSDATAAGWTEFVATFPVSPRRK